MQNIDSIKNINTSKFKKNLWCDKNLEIKRKSRCYKEVINPNLENQKHIFVLTSTKKNINIANIRTNSHELHSETRYWTIPKASRPKNIFHLCENMSVEDENYFLLEFPSVPTLDLNFKLFVTIQILLTL